MTDTNESVTSDRRRVYMSAADYLGRLATKYETLAADPNRSKWERAVYKSHASEYREAQKLQREKEAEPYPFANILGEGPNTSSKPGMFQVWHDPLLIAVFVAAIGAVIFIGILLFWR